MKITQINCDSLSVDLELDSLDDYLIARVKVIRDCCGNTQEFIEIPDINITDPNDEVYLGDTRNFVIDSSFFEDGLIDGVYTVEIILYKVTGDSYGDTGCIFVDCSTKCAVAEFIETLTDEKEKIQILMQHYSLTVGSNCSCECDNLCTIYKSLKEKIGDVTGDECGCV